VTNAARWTEDDIGDQAGRVALDDAAVRTFLAAYGQP
jgi:hypothetical protein